MAQTSYSVGIAAGFPGMIADSAIVQDIETVRNPDAALFFGCVATKGTADDEAIHPATATAITDEKLVKGIVLQSAESDNQNSGVGPSYRIKSVLPVMRKGRVWVKAEDIITVGTSTVNVRYGANGANTQLGALRGSADGSYSAVLPKSKFKTSTSAVGQLTILEIDL